MLPLTENNPAPNAEMQDAPFAVHLLDVGAEEYGDAVLCQFGAVSVLIDGAHPGDWDGSRAADGGESHESLPAQISRLLGVTTAPAKVTLLIVSHAHQDHIGCLPHLVERGLLAAEWALVAHPQLGWGRATDEPPAPLTDERIGGLVAALREEPRRALNDAETERFLSDAASLETRYLKMLSQLAAQGTQVIPFPFPTQGEALNTLQQFLAERGVELKVLGPSLEQAAICAALIGQATQRTTQSVTDALNRDAGATPARLYRQLSEAALADHADAATRPGPPVNLLSLVTQFAYRNQKFLFAGDMQFVRPEVSDERILRTVKSLRQLIAAEGPYAFAKISHHGSDNAFDEDFLRELGDTSFLGICAGEKSTAHPHPETLKILDRARTVLDWARTDHNRLTTFDFARANPQVSIARGTLDDARPNTIPDTSPGPTPISVPAPAPIRASAPVPVSIPAPAPIRASAPAPAPPPTNDAPQTEYVEVITRVPHRNTRVTVTIDVAPAVDALRPGAVPPPFPAGVPPISDALPVLNLAGGRTLPPLLFVTCRPRLAANIGQAECDHVLQTMHAHNWQVLELPAHITDIAGASAMVRQALQQNILLEGVVLLGGYDVAPAQRLDCLAPELRRSVAGHSDPDNFIVWSDSIYGDRDGDGLAEIPVSRIPDGHSAQLVFAALQAGNRQAPVLRRGIRNVNRPFAEGIYQLLPGDEALRPSAPQTYNKPVPYTLDADCVYLMLHGDYTDASRFWGEQTPDDMEAVNLSNIPPQAGEVVFTGCCWGALTADTPAGRILPGRGCGVKTPEQSLALTFILRGAKAFIGCTGVHYSPGEPPYDYFGGPMHQAFWRGHAFGKPPAKTLFEAKRLYLQGMHQRAQAGTSAMRLAIENKILRQYTCLGLGW